MINTHDTIAAISTAAGTAGRAIVRLSGPRALELAHAVFAGSQDLRALGGFRALDGTVAFGHAGEGGSLQLPARAYVFRAPRSFTRQDVIELHIPGSAVAACGLLESLIQAGARPAQAGEFTARAFMSGRLDLSQAQAVADVIDSADDTQLRAAARALGGQIARLCSQSAGRIADVLAAAEASIDLADEQIELDSPQELAERLRKLAAELTDLARHASDMPEGFHLPRVALCGYPNAGKSSLLNALALTQRAIVSDIAGTTRDVLGAEMTLGDSQVVLLQDAAGFSANADSLSNAANAAARAAVRAADVVLIVVDATVLPHAGADLLGAVREANHRAPVLVLANKADLLSAGQLDTIARELRTSTGMAPIATSAVSATGLDALRKKLLEQLNVGASRSAAALGLHQRQRRCFLDAADAAKRAADLLEASDTVAHQAELVAVELRQALAHLGGISGQVVTEDILARIFQRFCVGK